MEELIKAARRFINRDLLYIIAGWCVIVSFLYCYDRLPTGKVPVLHALLLTGISYPIGYVITDFLNLIRIVSTTPLNAPNKVVRWLYEVFDRRKWQDVSNCDLHKELRFVREYVSLKHLVQLERVITLKHIGNCIGGACLLIFCLLLAKAFSSNEAFDTALAVATGLAAVCLLILGWVQACTQTQFAHFLYVTIAAKKIPRRRRAVTRRIQEQVQIEAIEAFMEQYIAHTKDKDAAKAADMLNY